MGSRFHSIIHTPVDPHRSSIIFFSGIALSLAIGGASLGVAAESRSNTTKKGIYFFVGQNFPGASVNIDTKDLKTAGAMAVVSCFLLFLWFIFVAISTHGIKYTRGDRDGTSLDFKRNKSARNAIIAFAFMLWLLGALIGSTVIYATRGPKIEGSLGGNPVASDVLLAILGQLQTLGFTLALEYRNIPRTLVREAIIVQWVAWVFSLITTILLTVSAVAYRKMPNVDKQTTEAPLESRGINTDASPPATDTGIEEKNRDEAPTGITTTTTTTTNNNPYGTTETEKVTHQDV